MGWEKPSVYSVIVFVACLAALTFAVYSQVPGAAKALLTGVGAVILYLTQGPKRVRRFLSGKSDPPSDPPPPSNAPGGDS